GDDYYGIDDFTEIWWDTSVSGPDEIHQQGQGLMEFVDGGKRYRPGEWPSDLRVFDKNGAVSLYTELPAAETPKDYPSPAGGSGSGSSSSSSSSSSSTAAN